RKTSSMAIEPRLSRMSAGTSGQSALWSRKSLATRSIAAWPECRRGIERGTMNQRIETATLAGGCFWCLEAVFERLNGVQKVVSGYIGGKHPNPTNKTRGEGGHARAEVWGRDLCHAHL